MFALRNPRPHDLDRILAAHERGQLSYAQVGWSLKAAAPDGAFINQGGIVLGHGEAAFHRARGALAAWRMFPGGWLRAYTRETEVAAGNVVATVARYAGLWVVNACRVVYVNDDESDGVPSLSIGYGTLDGHLMRGEERFRVSWCRRDDSVRYDVWSFSWPQRWIARAALPLIRRVQRRFAIASPAAMQSAMSACDGQGQDHRSQP
jgi:uncharacterized protein (UPF0548 family)